MNPFLFWIDPASRIEGAKHVPFLYPFWGNALGDTTPYQKQVFDTFSFDTSLYGITENIGESDMVLVPHSHGVMRKHEILLDRIAATARAAGKPLLIDGTGDIEYPVPYPHAVVLRYGGYRFLNTENELHIPLYVDDLLARTGEELILRPYTSHPSVGFSGWAGITAGAALKTVLKELPVRTRSLFDPRYGACKKGIFFRRDAIHSLERSPDIEKNFLVRASYSGHTATAQNDPATLRREFIDNLCGSDYALDVRGDANASQRLFEILSLGRIPIIIDTERNYPFSDEIDYSAFSLTVDFRDLARLPEQLLAFHAALSPERFAAMQRSARDTFVEYFRVDSMTKHLIKRLRARIVQ